MHRQKLIYEVMDTNLIASTFGTDYLNALQLGEAPDALLITFPNGKRAWFKQNRPTKQAVANLCKECGITFVAK